jgi:lipoprotein Spr
MVKLPSWAREYIGIPFLDKGRTRDGCDCWGLNRLIWGERFFLWVPSFLDAYEEAHDGATVARAIVDYGLTDPAWREVAAGQERLGDGVHLVGYYKIDGRWEKAEMHVGIVLAPGVLIHIEEGIDASLMNYREKLGGANRVLGFYRHVELAR